MVGRFHRQLNTALKARADPTRWYEYLPLDLLGIRSSIKEEIGSTPAELLYGIAIMLPGQMVAPSQPASTPDPAKYVHRLRYHMSTIPPIATRAQQPGVHVPRDLNDWSHVFRY